MRNIRLTLAYDGTEYVGWQIQPNGTSVQAVVMRAIQRLTGEDDVKVIAAGRTDSGVHALGQVANFRTASSIPPEKLLTGLQRFLPEDVIVRDVCEVPDDFHATYGAKRKRYRYVLYNSALRDPFLRRYAWRYRGDLDVAAMHEAAQQFVGTHDFRSFETQWPNKATSVRTVMEATVRRFANWSVWSRSSSRHEPSASAPDEARESGDFICFDVVANGFLYNMVRAMQGTLLEVGRGKWNAHDVRRIIEAGDRDQAGDTAPAQGLYLVHVDYE